MQTIKTAVVVVLMLAIIYGVYVGLNGPETPLPPELENMALELDFSDGNDSFGSSETASGLFSPNDTSANNKTDSSDSSLLLGSTMDQGSTTSPSNSTTSSTSPAIDLRASSSKPSLPNPPTTAPSANELLLASSGNSNNQATTTSPDFSLESPSNTTSVPDYKSPSLSLPSAASVSQLVSSNNTLGPFATSGTPASPPADTANSASATPTAEPYINTNLSGLPDTSATKSFENALAASKAQIERGELRDALATLSLFYNAPELKEEQAQELLRILDSLASEVIYSRRHFLDVPYTVGTDETLESIATQFEVPSEILGRINAIPDPKQLMAGTKLKIVPGPFRAEISLESNEMTLFLGELYAGRFPVSLGKDPEPREGIFQVVDKQRNRNYYATDGEQIPGADPRNPYGGWWLDLGQDICIHGSPEVEAQQNQLEGCISLSPIDASDVFGMLSRGSQVQIRR